MEPMYRGVSGDVSTTLTDVFHASTDTSMIVYDVSRIPEAPNWITVRMANKSCLATFKYTGISGNTLTGLTFEESDVLLGRTATYPAGSQVYWSFTNRLLDNMITNITAGGGGGGGTTDYEALSNKPRINGVELKADKSLNTLGIVAIQQSTEDVGKSMVVQADGKLAPQLITPGGETTFAEIQGEPTDNTKLAAALSSKVDKVTGKGLSTNDYTTDDKTAVTNIETQLASNPNGKLSDVNYSTALNSKLVNIEAGAQKNVQADWSATTGDAYIKNKPEVTTKAYIDNADQHLQSQIDAIEAKSVVKDLVGTYEELIAYDVSKLTIGDCIEVVQDERQSHAVSIYRYIGGAQPDCWTYLGSTAQSYTKEESDRDFVKKITTINGKALSSDITLSYSDVGALSSATTLSQLPDDATHRTVTDIEKATWTNKLDKEYTSDKEGYIFKVKLVGGKYIAMPVNEGVSSKVQFSEIEGEPTENTKLAAALNGKVDKDGSKVLSTNDYTTDEKTKLGLIEDRAQKNVQSDWNATSGDAVVLNKPTVPTKTSQLTNDSSFTTTTYVDTKVTAEETARTEKDSDLQAQIDAIEARSLVKDLVGTYADLIAYDVSTLTVGDYLEVVQDETKSHAVTIYQYIGGAQPDCWRYIGSTAQSYTKKEADDTFVNKSRKINSKALSSDITLTASDVGALASTTTLANIQDDTMHRTVTDLEIAAWDNKVDKDGSKVLSTNDFTDAYKTKLTNIPEGVQANVLEAVKDSAGVALPITDKAVTLSKDAVGLGSVDNTSDENKPLSNAMKTALAGKEDSIGAKGSAFNKDFGTTAGTVCEGNDARLSDVRKPKNHASNHTDGTDDIQIATASQKGLLSSTDYTTFSGKQDKLTFDDSPSSASSNPVKSSGIYSALSGKVDKVTGKVLSSNDYTTAEKTKLTNIEAGAQVNVPSDWNATTGSALILNKPVIPSKTSQLTNDSSFTTTTYVNDAVSVEATARTAKDNDLQQQIDAIEAKSLVKDIVGTYAELTAYDVSKLTTGDMIEVLQDEEKSHAVSIYKYTGGSQPNCWDFVGSTAESYTKKEADEKFVPLARTINSKALSSNITLTASDVGALASTTTLADLPDDTTHRTITDAERTAWDNKVDKVTGKGLSTKDYTAEEQAKLDRIADGAQVNVLEAIKDASGNALAITGKAVTLSKSAVGLGNVDNTTDMNKPISTLTQNALNTKQNSLPAAYLHIIPVNANLVKSDYVSEDMVYRTYTWTLTTAVAGYPDTWISTLTSDYLIRTLTVKSGGVTGTVLATYKFNRTLDEFGNLLTETLSS